MYLIRVELHHANAYDALHAALAKRDIHRTIRNPGVIHQLPTGTYFASSFGDAHQVFAIVKQATAAIGQPRAWIVVAETDTIVFSDHLPVLSKVAS